MKIEVGDRVTYGDGYVGIVLDNEEINYQTVIRDREIVKVEKIGQNGWEVVEEKKELLTEEEREFLKLALKYVNKRAKYIFKNIYGIYLTNEPLDNDGYYRSIFIDYLSGKFFIGLEENKEYTLKELRIGGINYEFCKSRINTL